MKNKIGLKIKTRREILRLDKAQLAKESGYSRRYILDLEKSHIKNPSAIRLWNLCKILGLSLDYVVDDSIEVSSAGKTI